MFSLSSFLFFLSVLSVHVKVRGIENIAYLANWIREDQPWGAPISDVNLYAVAFDKAAVRQLIVPGYFLPTLTGVEVAGTYMSTAGNEKVRVTGTFLGPQNTYLDILRNVEYGPNYDGTWYKTTDCVVPNNEDNKALECSTVPGVGEGQSWRVSFSHKDPSKLTHTLTSVKTGYRPPVLSTFNGKADFPFGTGGGQSIVIVGSNFGNNNDALGTVLYSTKRGDTFIPNSCAITTPHTEITCEISAGAGGPLQWSLQVASQASTQPATTYGVPTVTHVDTYKIDDVSTLVGSAAEVVTAGGQKVVLRGSNFGPMERFRMVMGKKYVGPYIEAPVLTDVTSTAADCHRLCVSKEGTLGCKAFTYDDETRTCWLKKGKTALAYDASVVAGSTSASRYISGVLFDAELSLYAHEDQFIERVTYGPTGREYDVTSTCRVTTTSTEVTCTTVPGVGKDLYWYITVAGKTNIYATPGAEIKWSYAAPVIRGIAPLEEITDGGYTITIVGDNFGPREAARLSFNGLSSVNALDPSKYAVCPDGSSDAAVPAVTCGTSSYVIQYVMTSAGGQGENLPFQVKASYNGLGGSEAQDSPPFLFSFKAPVLKDLFTQPGPTAVSTRIILYGSNFGLASKLLPENVAESSVYNYVRVEGTGTDTVPVICVRRKS